ncbi:MAG TPA: carboxypeptidase-like regulatory domain-containing protein [Candidatus Alistipes merdigallinarum]|nr:carboxypeptidase-like regulatory domain-containing protein [Candidatus Alistipes merdigallinarum]
MISRGVFLFLSAILFVCHIVSAQNPTGKLWGIVVDSTNRDPLIGATVIVRSAQDSIMTISNSKGGFFISHIRDSLVTTEISYLGYKKIYSRGQNKPC